MIPKPNNAIVVGAGTELTADESIRKPIAKRFDQDSR